MISARTILPNSILRIRSTTSAEALADQNITNVVIKDDANPDMVRQLDDKIKTAYVTGTYGVMRTLIDDIPPHIAVILVSVEGAFVTVFRKESGAENKVAPSKRKRAAPVPHYLNKETLFGAQQDFSYIHNFSSANVIRMMLTDAPPSRLLRRANQTSSFSFIPKP